MPAPPDVRRTLQPRNRVREHTYDGEQTGIGGRGPHLGEIDVRSLSGKNGHTHGGERGVLERSRRLRRRPRPRAGEKPERVIDASRMTRGGYSGYEGRPTSTWNVREIRHHDGVSGGGGRDTARAAESRRRGRQLLRGQIENSRPRGTSSFRAS